MRLSASQSWLSIFSNRLITSDSNSFLFRKYTNHLQVLFVSVFTKLPWQAAQTFRVYIKRAGMNQCFCARVCGDAGGWVRGGLGSTLLGGGAKVWVRGPSGRSRGHSHLHAKKWLRRQPWCWRPCLWAIMGSNQRQTAYREETASQLPSSLKSSSAFLKARPV